MEQTVGVAWTIPELDSEILVGLDPRNLLAADRKRGRARQLAAVEIEAQRPALTY